MENDRGEGDARCVRIFEPMIDGDNRVNCPEGEDTIEQPNYYLAGRHAIGEMESRKELGRWREGSKRLVRH